jgi:hypothetical protein
MVLENVIGELEDAAVREHPDLRLAVGHDTPERRELVIEGLEEIGLFIRRHKVEERAEQLAQECLAVLKAEHGIPA